MRRLTTARTDRGGAMVSFAIALVVVMGFVGLGIDGSAVFAKRQQVQNGADAAAFAVAQSYAVAGCVRDAAMDEIALDYATANVIMDQDTTEIDDIECGDDYVRVRASADQPPFFMSFVGIDEPMRVPAAATVEWGSPLSGDVTFPISFSTCEFEAQLEESEAGIIELNTSKDSDTYGSVECEYSEDWPESGNNFPGGFGFLLSDTGGCTPTITVDGWVTSSSGNSVGGMGCSFPALPFTALLPLFDDCKTGSPASSAACRYDGDLSNDISQYHVSRFAAFRVVGYDFNAGVKDGAGCSKKPCIVGEFVEYVEIGDEFEVGPLDPHGNVVIIRLRS